jgi:hypothetical protein
MKQLTGYQQDAQGIWIAKDPSANLIYSLDWSEWLPAGDSIASVTHALQVRVNDPAPIIRGTDGVQSGTVSFVQISGGGVGKIYTVTATITTTDGLTDSRNFRIKVENRSA